MRMLKKKIDYDNMAAFFSILTNPVRLRILDYLLTECCKRKEGCCSVSDIYLELDLPQPLISKHLKILKAKGLLDYTRQGNRILYYFADNCNVKIATDCLSRVCSLKQPCKKPAKSTRKGKTYA
jgi:DNA-binding transcriptional ArsR family regulator